MGVDSWDKEAPPPLSGTGALAEASAGEGQASTRGHPRPSPNTAEEVREQAQKCRCSWQGELRMNYVLQRKKEREQKEGVATECYKGLW